MCALSLLSISVIWRLIEYHLTASVATTHPTYTAEMISLLEKLDQITTEDPRISYWAIDGTLLGWARTGSILEYDDDVDVGVSSDVLDLMGVDANVHNLLVRHNLSLCLKFGPRDPSKIFSVHSFYPFVDLIRYRSEGKTWISQFDGEDFTSGELFPLQRCTLSGVKIWCPHSPLPFLERMYGGLLSWILYGRHWSVPLHYSEHNVDRVLPYSPKSLHKENKLICQDGAVNMKMPHIIYSPSPATTSTTSPGSHSARSEESLPHFR
jgi:hypothetical protein